MKVEVVPAVEGCCEGEGPITAGRVEKAAAYKAPDGQPMPLQGFEPQQPWKLGVCTAHVHHDPKPHFTFGQNEESLTGKSGPAPVPIPAGRRSFNGQPEPLHGSLVQHPKKVGDWAVQVYHKPPRGHVPSISLMSTTRSDNENLGQFQHS